MKFSWVVTQAGLVTAGGAGREALLAALVAGEPLFASPDGVDFPVAEIRGFDARTHLSRKGIKDLSRTSQLACSAAAGVAGSLDGLKPHEVGVVFGSAWGSLRTVVDFEREAAVEGPRFVDPIRFTETVANVPAGQVSIFFGWSAFNATVSAGAASGLLALILAVDFLEEGRGLVAVAGGGDELNLPILRSLHSEGAVASSASSLPFGAGRSGPVGGEGACFLTLESDGHARSRGTAPLARIRATASCFDGAGAAPAKEIEDLLRSVLEKAQLAPRGVDLLILPANGSPTADAVQAAAIQAVFGSGTEAPPVIVPKGILGEIWGAYGPAAMVVGSQVMRTGTVPGRPRGLRLDRGLEGLNLPQETSHRPVRSVLVLDGSTTGHFMAAVISAPEEGS